MDSQRMLCSLVITIHIHSRYFKKRVHIFIILTLIILQQNMFTRDMPDFLLLKMMRNFSTVFPTGAFDIPLLIQDRHSIYQPQFNYAPNIMDRMLGYLGDVPLVNGTPQIFISKFKKHSIGFRIVNGSNARVYKLGFSDNSQFWLIGTDGGLKDEAVPATKCFFITW